MDPNIYGIKKKTKKNILISKLFFRFSHIRDSIRAQDHMVLYCLMCTIKIFICDFCFADLIPANELNDIKRELYGDTIKPVHLFKVTTISGHSRSGGKGFQSRTKQSIVTKSRGDLNKRKKNTAEKNTDLNDISYQERPYPCPQCNKRFKVKHHLVYHLRVHSGERPYKCETCNSTFTQTSSLKTHIQAKHWKSCMCRNCGQLFKSRFFMSQHTCGSMGSEEERKDDLVVLE